MTYDVVRDVTPIFVLGSPRSGTTVIGSYVGSGPEIADFQELAVFFFTHWMAKREYDPIPTPIKEAYVSELEQHAIDFAVRQTRALKCRFFCDSTPWNLRIASYLDKVFPHAIFVLTLRHYAGVIQSLERSYRDGWEWAGSNVCERAQVWTDFYANARDLPRERTVAFSYDRFCDAPVPVLQNFCARLAALGVPTGGFSLSLFERSHATTEPRPTIGEQNSQGRTLLRPMPSFDNGAWSGEETRAVEPVIRETEVLLRELFPYDYAAPAGWTGSENC